MTVEASPPEFSRRVSVDQIGAGGHKTGIAADEVECAALAKRFGWTRIERLTANANLLAREDGIDALGTLNAEIERACAASGEPVRESVEEAFAIHFVSADTDAVAEGEFDLDEDDLDVVEFDGAAVDIGEAVAQTLALSVDPFPRSPAAEAKLRAAGVLAEGEVGSAAFAGLKGLLKG
jgi:uncharacterized metal-binding protein YceD (DUF177 family)